MSDTGRQSLTDKATSAAKPESQKSFTEKVGDTTKGATDSVASTLQPEGEKSSTQKATDTVSGNSNENQESLVDKAKSALGVGQQGKGQ
ncbi:hypothetical protein BDN67DRAFT_922103 [Paxillus ammoniavirescens]|nr:hypothetical protein BDN67DRAFT_922103 [Paxillus ammoniavirescens]